MNKKHNYRIEIVGEDYKDLNFLEALIKGYNKKYVHKIKTTIMDMESTFYNLGYCEKNQYLTEVIGWTIATMLVFMCIYVSI